MTFRFNSIRRSLVKDRIGGRGGRPALFRFDGWPATVCMFVCLVLLATGPADGSSPRLNTILPRGVQRGSEHVLRFSGARLIKAQQVFLYDSPRIEVIGLQQVDDNNVEVTIRVDAKCRLGEHIAQIRTARGISDYRSFYVGAMTVVDEVEPNNSFDTAQSIQQNRTIHGVVANEDVDYFRIQGLAGQRLSVEIEAIRLGYMFDPVIAVLDADKFELATSDDSALARQDGLVTVQLPQDGEYYVMVREASFGGNDGSRYRLHVGRFPRPTVAYPAGGPVGTEMDISFLGDANGPIQRTIQVEPSEGLRDGLFVSDDLGVTPSPIAFRRSPLQNVLEQEPNNTWPESQPASLPIAFNGVIGTPRDQDWHKFAAKKGEQWDIHCYARRIKSGLDPVINVFNAKTKKHIIGDDDARRPDCYLRFAVPEDGEYVVRVTDHLRRGQADFVYRIELTRPTPAVRFSIPRVDRYSQLRQQVAVPRGNRFATLVSAQRYAFGGELKLLEDRLPDGVRMVAQPMRSNLNLMPVVFEASDEAELQGSLIDLRGQHVDPERSIEGNFWNVADFALGEPNNARYYGCQVNRLAVAVTEHVPFRLELVQPNVPLVRNGSMNLKIVAHRDEGFEKPIRIQFPFRPPGIGTRYQVEIPQGKNEINYPLNANGNAQLGNWPVYCIGWSDVEGPAWVSTQLAELQVAEPLVQFEIGRTVCEQGKTTQIVAKLKHLASFEGEARAEILGVPAHVKVQPKSFTATTQELIFPVETTDQSPVGKHKSLFCRVTVTKDGEPIVSTTGRTELQITAPRPDPVAQSKTQPAKTGPSAEQKKPKSRLQQLREQAATGRSNGS